MGINIASGTDDNVLDASGYIDFSLGQVGQIAGVQPVFVKQALGFLRITVIAAGGRGAAKLQPPFLAFG